MLFEKLAVFGMTAEKLETFSPGVPLRLDDDGNVIENSGRSSGERPDVTLTRIVKTVAADHGISFAEAQKRVMSNPRYENEVCAYHLYANPKHEVLTVDHSRNTDPLKGRNGADEKVKELAEDYMRQKGEKNFIKAVEHVLQGNPDLRAEYAACVGRYS